MPDPHLIQNLQAQAAVKRDAAWRWRVHLKRLRLRDRLHRDADPGSYLYFEDLAVEEMRQYFRQRAIREQFERECG